MYDEYKINLINFSKFTSNQIRSERLKELKTLRAKNSLVKDWEKIYHRIFNTNIRDMNEQQLNDLIIFIVNNIIAYETAFRKNINVKEDEE